jgi:hypothetical protein
MELEGRGLKMAVVLVDGASGRIPAHSAFSKWEFLSKHTFLDLPYLSDLAPSDLFAFPSLKLTKVETNFSNSQISPKV